jgi:flagellar biosynthesis GTPase FlhF
MAKKAEIEGDDLLILTALGAQSSPVPFDYSPLPAEHAKLASEAAAVIKTSHKQIGGYIFAIGQKLTAVKEVMDHGQFGTWLAAEFQWTDRTARNYMAVWATFGDKSETISDLPPATIYALAAPSTPAAVRERVVERLEAGERIAPAAVNGMIREARSHAKMAAAEVKITDEERKRQERAAASRKRRNERLRRDIEREQQEREAREQASEKAADQAVEFLTDHLGDDLPAFIELAKAAGMAKIGQRLGVTVFLNL